MAGIIKDVGLVALSVSLYGSQVTVLQCMGYGVALAGVVHHNIRKLHQTAPTVAAEGAKRQQGGGAGDEEKGASATGAGKAAQNKSVDADTSGSGGGGGAGLKIPAVRRVASKAEVPGAAGEQEGATAPLLSDKPETK